MLYCAVKTGIQVSIADMGLNVFYDLVEYSASIDAVALAKADGKNVNYESALSIADMTMKGKMRG